MWRVAGDTGLLMEQFPVVTILFCSFDKEAVKECLRAHDAEHFLTLLSTMVIEFDILLENNNLYKVPPAAGCRDPGTVKIKIVPMNTFPTVIEIRWLCAHGRNYFSRASSFAH